jgi:hypothetical protein
MEGRPDTLSAAGRRYWKTFLAMWAAPVVWVSAFVAADRIGHPLLGWWVVGCPFFFWSFVRPARLWLTQRIRYWHWFILGIVIPVIVFIGVSGFFAMIGLLP